MAKQATLGGVPILWDAPISWQIRTGVTPTVASFEFERGMGEALLAAYPGVQPVSLILDDVEVKDLFMITTTPSTHPDRIAIGVADCRWLWQYYWIGPTRYNWRKRSGDRRWIPGTSDDEGALTDDLANIADNLKYMAWSLKNNEVVWNAAEILKETMLELRAKLAGVYSMRVEDPASVVKRFTQSSPIDTFGVGGKANQAISSVLSKLGAITLYPDLDGKIRWVDTIDGSDVLLVPGGKLSFATQGTQVPGEGESSGAAPGPILWDTTIATVADRSRMKPRRVEVFFAPEYEVRHDFLEGVEDPSRITGSAPRRLDNVLRVTDRTLTVSGSDLTFGTWITFEQAYAAWGPDGADYSSTLEPGLYMSKEEINRDIISGMMYLYFGGRSEVTPAGDPDWLRRVGEINSNYRRTFRIKREWLDRCLSWSPLRASIIDPATGERARSMIYTDYEVFFPLNSLRRHGNEEDMRYSEPKVGYHANLDEAKPGSIRLKVLDKDLGIFQAEFLDSQWYPNSRVFPSLLDEDTAPSLKLIGRGAESISEESMALSETHNLAMVASFSPASPPGTAGMYLVSVEPSDVQPLLGNRRLGSCLGPPLQIVIDRQLATARHAWRDSSASRIEAAFGMDGGQTYQAELEKLIVNKKQLRAIAQAAAAVEYARLIDRADGALTLGSPGGGHLIDIKPTGNLGSVDFTITERGDRITGLTFNSVEPNIDLASLLPEGTRQRLGQTLGGMDR